MNPAPVDPHRPARRTNTIRRHFFRFDGLGVQPIERIEYRYGVFTPGGYYYARSVDALIAAVSGDYPDADHFFETQRPRRNAPAQVAA